MGTQRQLRATVFALIVMLALLAFGASQAQAIGPGSMSCQRDDNSNYECNTSVASLTYYKGWGHTAGGYCGGMNPGDEVLAAASAPRAAWRWTRYGWQRASLPTQTQVYIWPYAVAWSWAWTSTSGWVAIRDADLVINPYCPPMP